MALGMSTESFQELTEKESGLSGMGQKLVSAVRAKQGGTCRLLLHRERSRTLCINPPSFKTDGHADQWRRPSAGEMLAVEDTLFF